MRPRFLDLFGGAGGAAMGYHRAGWDVTCVDIAPQPHCPFEFIQADAIRFAWQSGRVFDAIGASPPCQVHSDLRTLAGPGHVDLIPQTREVLAYHARWYGIPYVIENVEGAPLLDPIELCGSMFDLGADCADGVRRVLRRHRLFESNLRLVPPGPDACAGREIGGVYGDGGGGPQTRGYKFYAGESRAAMGIDWMNRRELSQAIPPVYTEHVGRQLLAALRRSA